MKIAYIGQMADLSTENGISKKIRAQTVHWQQAGHEVHYFSLTPDGAVWAGMQPLQTTLLPRGSPLRRMWQSHQLCRAVRAWKPDVIYFRYAYHSAGFPGLFRAIPTVAELNSDDLAEYPITLSRAKVVYHRATRARVLAACAGFVPVTVELGARFGGFGKPTVVIANGIDLDAFEVAPPPDVTAPRRLVFVGSAGTPWHGLERINELAAMFPEFFIDVIGTERVGATPNVRFHGHLTRERYEALLHSATAAIGTMALFKKRMDEACPLKVREYLATGLPVIAAYRDTDIPETAKFFLRLPNGPQPLHAQRAQIAEWLARWQTHRVPRAAVAHLDNRVKERQRMDFLARIASSRTPRA